MVKTRSNKIYKPRIECSIVIVRHPNDYLWDIRCAWHRRSLNTKHFPEKLELPGGKRMHGESFIRAAYRELEEETGLHKHNVTPLRLVKRIRNPPTKEFGEQFIYITTTNVPIHKWKSYDDSPWEWHNPNTLLDTSMYSLGPIIREIILSNKIDKHLLLDHR